MRVSQSAISAGFSPPSISTVLVRVVWIALPSSSTRTSAPWAMVVPKGVAFARSGSTWMN